MYLEILTMFVKSGGLLMVKVGGTNFDNHVDEREFRFGPRLEYSLMGLSWLHTKKQQSSMDMGLM